ncbi:MAG: protein translocase subunit SecF [Spirochaetota bacterium]
MGKTPNINLIGIRRFAYFLSAAIIVGGMASIALHGGLNMGIDFAGGNMIQVNLLDEQAGIGQVREVLLETGYGDNVQRLEDPRKNLFILKAPVQEENNEQVISVITGALHDRFGEDRVVVERVDIVGPRISRYLLRTSYVVGVVALVLILLYISFRFRFRFGIAAIAALVHDVLVVVAFLSFFGKEMDTFILAALLTIIGYSLNDTIVVFDRARENLKSSRAYQDYSGTVNTSINQSLSRTLITSLTTLLAVLSLYIFGGSTMRNFAFALIVGVLVGTYSSTFVASAIVVEWHGWRPEKIKKA